MADADQVQPIPTAKPVSTIAVKLYVAAYVLLFLAWLLLVTFHVTDADDLLAYIKDTLALLTGHVLTVIPIPSSD